MWDGFEHLGEVLSMQYDDEAFGVLDAAAVDGR